MKFLISSFFWIVIIPAIKLIMFPISLIVWAFTFLFDKRLKALQFIANIWGSSYTWLNPFVSVEIEGRENIDPNKTYVMTPNHTSLMDIPAIHRLFVHFKWVSKASLAKVPFIGWNMLLNKTIFLKRTDPKSQFKMMRLCEMNLKLRNSIMIYPEGTRHKGRALGKFHAGAFLMAKKMMVDVLPIAIVDSDKAVEGFTFKKFSTIKVKVLPSIPHDMFKKTRDLSEAVKGQIEQAIATM